MRRLRQSFDPEPGLLMTLRILRRVALLLAIPVVATGLMASETSILVDILVRKGILTEAEAREVLDEVAQLSTEPVASAGPAESEAEIPDPEPKPAVKEPVWVAASSKIAGGFKLGGRLQVQYAGLETDIDGQSADPDPTRHFFLRRVYLGTDARFGEQWSAKVTYDFSGAGFDAAYLRFKADDRNLFDFGLRKVNLGYEEVISSGSIPAIERSAVTRYFVEPYNGRRLGAGSYRIGVFHEGEAGNLFYGASVTNPERPASAVDAASQGNVANRRRSRFHRRFSSLGPGYCV